MKQSVEFIQLKGTLKRIGIERRRNICGTFCEFFSHFLILFILVLGYYQSKIVFFPQRSYTTLDIQIPPNVVVNPTLSESLKFYFQVMDGPLVIPDLDQYIAIGKLLKPYNNKYHTAISQTTFGRSFTNLFDQGTLHFAPNSPETLNLIDYLNITYKSFHKLEVRTHSSEEVAVDFIMKHLRPITFALIVLKKVSPSKINFIIRQNYSTIPNTNKMIINPADGLHPDFHQYFLSGFLTLQKAVDQWAFQYSNLTNSLVSECAAGPPNAVLIPYPTFAYSQNPFYYSVGFLLGLTLVMSTMYPMSKLTKSMVEEKETKMRELMKIMGLKNWVYSCSWFLSAFVLFFFVALTMTVISTSTFIRASNKFIIFVYFFSFCLSEISFSFLVSVFFSNSKLAAIAAPVALFCAILPRYLFFATNENENVFYKILACFLSPTAFTFAADSIATYEYGGIGVHFSNLFDGKFNMAICIFMTMLDFVIYALLAWYFDNILPHEYGTSQNPLFLFDSKYWCGDESWTGDNQGLGKEKTDEDFEDMPEFYDGPMERKNGEGVEEMMKPEETPELQEDIQRNRDERQAVRTRRTADIESIPRDLRDLVKIRIKDLGKSYSDGKIAVQHLSLSMLEGQITCLLGHNGAGKTTTISALTGLIEATAGDVSIYGHSLRRELATVRRMTGLCPQQNVLFPALTVEEHLQFFGNVKGMTGKTLLDAIDGLIEEVGLTEKRHVRSHALSGGMKRKLCLAMALIGNPKFILLDEPTSGMDPYSRRSTWELLQRSKVGRVILLTTHFMEEADTLADRIAILSQGTLLCSGSSLFLKNRFGLGYVLSLSRVYAAQLPHEYCNREGMGKEGREIIDPHDEIRKAVNMQAVGNIDQINLAVQEIIECATLKSAIAGEIIYQLPLSTSALFPALFQMLQSRNEELGIGSYGISITSLEQVFISLARQKLSDCEHEMENEEEKHTVQEIDMPTSIISQLYEFCQCLPSFKKQNCIHEMSAIPAVTPPYNAKVLRSVEDIEMQDLERVSKHQETIEPYLIPEISSPIRHLIHNPLSHGEGNQNETEMNSADLKSTKARVELESSYCRDDNKEAKTVFQTIKKFTGVLYCLVNKFDSDLSWFTDSNKNEENKKTEDTCHIWLIQFVELYRKRYLIAMKDLKGLFFQVIFPAIQILLILFILMIEVNPAGRSILLNGDIYARYGKFTPYSLVSTHHYSEYETNLQGYYHLDNSSSANSTLLSSYLLQKDTYQDHRLGAYVFQDDIPLNLTVDWNWVRSEIKQGNITGETVATALTILNIDNYTFTVHHIPTDTVAKELGVNLTAVNHDITTSSQSSSRSPNNQYLENLLYHDLNISLPWNLSSRGVTKINMSVPEWESLFNQSGTVDAKVTIEKTGLDVVLYNQYYAEDVFFPWNSMNLTMLLPFMPTGIVNYDNISLSSPYTILHNSSSPHAVAAWHGELVKAAYQTCYSAIPREISHDQTVKYHALESSEPPTYYIKNHPLPITVQKSVQIRIILSLLTSIFVLVPLCYIPASFVAFLVKERVSKSKHLQLVSGVSPYLYWTATYIWDMTLICLLIGLIMITLLVMGKKTASTFIGSHDSSLATFSLLFLYGSSSVLLSYIYSFAFVNFSTAQIAIMLINFMSGFVLVLGYYVLVNIPQTKSAADIAVNFFRFFPPYNVGEGLINLSVVYYQDKYLGKGINVFEWDVTGRNLVFMFAETVGFFAFIMVSESPIWKRFKLWLLRVQNRHNMQSPPPRKADIEEDVLAEELYVKWLMGPALQHKEEANWVSNYSSYNALGCSSSESKESYAVDSMPDDFNVPSLLSTTKHSHCFSFLRPPSVKLTKHRFHNDPTITLLIDSLVKAYPTLEYRGYPKYAVGGISLVCREGERFGLLGINGAGKTTTLGILTGEIHPTSGNVYIGGKSLADPSTQQMIGFCPQVDPLLELMNAYETLWFFGRIRGIVPSKLVQRIQELIQQTGLTPYAHKPCGTYSGGNKRKLSLAVALIGDPKVLLLDEPSTGMDPEARRHMWEIIQLVSANRTVILVSHSMEEIEALCTRVGVMASGRLQCLGSIQHLKGRFGGGYLVEVRCAIDKIQDCLLCCQSHFEGSEINPVEVIVEEQHGGYFRLKVGQSLNLVEVFEYLENNKTRFHIFDYNVSQCSLEQVFLKIAKEQEEEPTVIHFIP